MSISHQSPRFGPVLVPIPHHPPPGLKAVARPSAFPCHVTRRSGGSAAPFVECCIGATEEVISCDTETGGGSKPHSVVHRGPNGAAEADVFGFTVSTRRHSMEQLPSPPHIFTAALGRVHGLAIRLSL